MYKLIGRKAWSDIVQRTENISTQPNRAIPGKTCYVLPTTMASQSQEGMKIEMISIRTYAEGYFKVS